MQRVEGTLERCGSARSPHLCPEAAHLNQKTGSGELLKVSQQAHVQPGPSWVCRERGEGVGSLWTAAELLP